MKNGITASFKNKYFKIGGYSVALSFAVLAIAVVINLLVTALPSTLTKFDATGSALYSISDESKKIVDAIDKDVTVYFIAETGSEDAAIKELLDRYSALSGHITVKQIDPARNPNFTAKYSSKALNPSSLIFVSAIRNYVVDYSEIYGTSYSDEEIQNYYYYGTKPTGTTSFAGESKITGALEYVTSDDIPVIYALGGHGESAFGEKMSGYIKNDNIAASDLSLLTTDSVPEDATCLIINNPTSDISSDELAKIKAYLDGGGYLILLTSYTGKEMTNLYSLAAGYGAEYVDGMVVEGNANYYMSGKPYFLIPKIQSSDISALISSNNMNILLPVSHGIKKSSTLPENVTVTSLLTTSAAAYTKLDAFNIESFEKQAGDLEGPFDLAVLAENSSTGAKLVWFSSPYIADDSIDVYVSGGNSTFFLSTLSYLCARDTSVSIAAKSMQVAALVIDDLSANIWSAVITVIIPAGTIILGTTIWLKRRKR